MGTKSCAKILILPKIFPTTRQLMVEFSTYSRSHIFRYYRTQNKNLDFHKNRTHDFRNTRSLIDWLIEFLHKLMSKSSPWSQGRKTPFGRKERTTYSSFKEKAAKVTKKMVQTKLATNQ